MTQAINYTLNNSKGLEEFVHHDNVPRSNQQTEQSIRPFVLIRNLCKFYVSPKRAATAMIYSLVITAIENSIQPYMYFQCKRQIIRH